MYHSFISLPVAPSFNRQTQSSFINQELVMIGIYELRQVKIILLIHLFFCRPVSES